MHMDLTLGTLVEATQEVQEEHQALGQDRQHGGGEQGDAVEREHLFDKVLTPSDVGKLNRLVVPKQNAERFFPVAGAGTQLCFEDRAGAPWRFRYSYWGSSQSYVMTKGWSRFVRAARLAAGDTVSFSRGAGGRYFIDYRQCQRRRREISFGDAPAAVPAWPFLDRVQRTSSITGGEGAIGATDAVDTVPVAGHHDAEAGPSGARSFRLFGFNVECSRDDDAAMEEEEYVDDDN